MQNLMTPLQKYKNKLGRRIKTLTNKIQEKKEKIEDIQSKKKRNILDEYLKAIKKQEDKTKKNRKIRKRNQRL